MACQGPDLNSARKAGNAYARQLLKQMVKEQKISPPSRHVWTIPNADKRWNKARRSFILAVEEMFVEDACNSW